MNSDDLIKELYDYFIKNESKIINLNELRRIVGNYTSTQILDLVEKLEDKYKIKVYYDKALKRFSMKEIEGFKDVMELNRTIKIGFISNPRLVCRYSTIGALYAAYEIFRLEEVVWIDAINLFNDTIAYKRSPKRKAEYLSEMEDLTTRLTYVAKIYPEIEGVKTHVVPTKRDIALFRVDGRMVEVNQVRELCKLRNDIRLEEREFQDVYRTNVRIYLLSAHNDDGVTSSYTRDAQERVEKLNFDKNYYNIVVIGGYHVPFEIPNYGGADYIISLPSLIRQTAYMREFRRVAPFIGCYVLELNLGEKKNGVRKLEALRTRLYNLERYSKPNDFYEYPQIKDFKEKKLIDYLFEKSPATLGELCRNLNMKEDEVRNLINSLNKREKFIITEREHNFYIKLPYKDRFDYPKIQRGDEHKFLFISDTHINSNYSNLEDIYLVASIAKSENVDAAFHVGDILEVIPGFELYSGQRYRVKTQSAKEIIEYVHKMFDAFYKQDIPMYFITGNHDTKMAKAIGMDILEIISQLYSINKNPNMINFVGEERGTVDYKNSLRINMIHPSRGAAETLGYNINRFYKYVKLLGNGINRVLLIGNYHKALFIYDPLHYPAYLVPCMKYPDDYVETKGLTVQKGSWISTFEIDDKGIILIENKYVNLPIREIERAKTIGNNVTLYDKII